MGVPVPARRWLAAPMVVVLALLSAPAPGGADAFLAGAGKIRFDLSQLDAAGLYGPAGGRRALSYAFCIPDRAPLAAEVRAIDASLRLTRAPGRIGCGGCERLCVGSTHQSGYRQVLAALAGRPYVKRIEQAFFE